MESDVREVKKGRDHKRSLAVMVRRVGKGQEEITLMARGISEKPEWMKAKKRICLWCGKEFNSNNAGDRYHPECRLNAARVG